jgi:hypothetical protein
MLTNKEIKSIADDVLRATLGPSGFERSDATEDVDSDGEQALFITARFKHGVSAADGKVALAALKKLRATLQKHGEERFPYLRFDYPDDEIPSAPAEDFQH